MRFGILGLEHWYSAIPFIQRLEASPDHDVVKIYETAPGQVDEVLPGLSSSVSVVNSWQEITDDPNVDIVVSFLRTSVSKEAGIAAARNKKLFAAGKPFAHSLDSAREIVDSLGGDGNLLFPIEAKNREAAPMRFAHQALQSGDLGDILRIDFSIGATLPEDWKGSGKLGWFGDPNEVLGGGWVDHAVYQADLASWFLGGDTISSITAQVGSFLHKDIGLEDWGRGEFVTAGGVHGSLSANWISAGWQSTVLVTGSKGSLLVDGAANTVAHLSANTGGWARLATPPDYAKPLGIDSIVAAAQGQQPLGDTGIRAAWHNFAVCHAFYESVRTGSAAAVEPFPG